jgi:hypothetical protein
MIHLQSNQRLYISEDLRGYVDKLMNDGTIPYAVDFLQLGFAHAVREELEPATEFDRHTITTNTDILGNSKLVIEAVAQWYARSKKIEQLEESSELLRFICDLGASGGRELRDRWSSRSKSQIQSYIIDKT